MPLFVVLALVAGVNRATSGSVLVTWVPNPNTNIVGYKVYYGTASQVYTTNFAAGNVTNTSISGLASGTYYFAATSYDAASDESAYSAEASCAVTNQPPTLNPVANLSLAENAGPQTVNLTGISSGDTNNLQTITVTVVSSDPTIIPTPVVNYASPNTAATLTFAPALNAVGTVTITVTVNNGNPDNNVTSQTFRVTVNAVNQPPTLNPPTLNPIAPLSIVENAGAQTVTLTGISSGATNQALPLMVTAVSSNPTLIPTPVINYVSPNATGTLTFAPASNAVGTATITVNVNNGDPSNNIVSQSFTVTVNAVNQPPTLNPIPNSTINENTNRQTVQLTGITSGNPGQNQTLTVTAASSNTGLLQPSVSYTSPNANGTLTFKPAKNHYGVATITVTLKNSGNSNNIVTRSFTVTVLSPTQAAALAKVSISGNAAAILTPVSCTNGQYSFTVLGAPGSPYIVQASTDLVHWTTLLTNTAPFTVVDTNVGMFIQRFYRVGSTR